MEGSDCSLDELLAIDPLQEVWRGHDRLSRRDVLVRLVRTPLGRDERRRFDRTVERFSHARHPRLEAIRGLIEAPERSGLVVDPALGTMAQWVDIHGPVPLDKVVDIGRGLLEGLAYAHHRRLFHGAIHPGALWTDAEGNVRLGELAIGRLIFESDACLPTEALWHRLPFMAPELRLRQAAPSLASDLYGVAATLAWLAKGDMAGDLHVPATCDRLQTKLPEGFVAVLRKAAAWAPEQRYADADVMATALADAALEFDEDDRRTVDLTDLPGPAAEEEAIEHRPTSRRPTVERPRPRPAKPQPVDEHPTAPHVRAAPPTRASMLPWAIAVASVGVAAASLLV